MVEEEEPYLSILLEQEVEEVEQLEEVQVLKRRQSLLSLESGSDSVYSPQSRHRVEEACPPAPQPLRGLTRP